MNFRRSKIFGIGLSKTATSSLSKALEELGFSSIHNPLNLKEIKKFQSATDIAVASQFQYLDKEYPDSKFIFTTRQLDSWLESCKWHFSQEKINNHPLRTKNPKKFSRILELRYEFYGVLEYNQEVFREKFFTHENQILEYFSDRKSDLLIMDIPSGDGWDMLCPFLNIIDFPNRDFPHINRRIAL